MNTWKKQYYNLYTENNLLKEYISKLEKGYGVGEQINNYKTLLNDKDKLIIDLSLQVKEYQSKCDEIILGRSNEIKEKQIEILLNEVKGIRKRILSIVTFNERITNFEDFMSDIKIIQELEKKNKDKKIKKAFENLNYLIEIYKQNDNNASNKLIRELFFVNQNIDVNNQVNNNT